MYNERGPKYKVRDDVIKKLNSMNESFESDLERKLVRMWFNEDQAAWLVKHDPETAEWLAYGNIRTQDLIDVEQEINQKMAVKKIKESSKSLREFKDTKIGATSVNNSLEEDWSKGLSFTFKITTNSLQNAFKNGSVRVGGQNKADLSSMYGDTSLRFKIVGKPYSSANDGYINVDRNESELHVNLYDKDFTYKDIGGKSNFNKAKLTQEMEELKNSIENDLKDAGLVITQSKVEVGGSPKFNTTWRQAQKYNEDLDLSNDKDFDTYLNFNSDLYNAMSDVVYDYSSKGISKKDIEKAVEWFLTHFFDDYDEGKLEENKHIQKAKSYTSAKSKSPLSESRWDDYDDEHLGESKSIAMRESVESTIKSDDVWSTPESAAKSLFDRGLVASDYVERACKRHGKDQDFAYEVGVIISQLIEEDEHLGESKSINEDMSEEDYDEFFSIVDKIGPAINTAGGDMDDINGNLSHPYEDEDRIKIVFVSTVDKKDAKKFVKTVEAEIEKAMQTTRFNRVRDIYVYQLSDNDLQMRVPASLRSEFSKKFSMFEIDIRASADL